MRTLKDIAIAAVLLAALVWTIMIASPHPKPVHQTQKSYCPDPVLNYQASAPCEFVERGMVFPL